MCKLKKYKKGSTRPNIDNCMRIFIEYLTDYLPHEVVACCCGHGKYPMSVVVENYNRRSGKRTFFEIFSGKIIPREKKFYKRDKQGYYFIPETLTKLNYGNNGIPPSPKGKGILPTII